jgi:hypothetical protein
MTLCFAAAVALMASAFGNTVPAHSETPERLLSIGSLSELCQSRIPERRALCLGYMMGAMDAAHVTRTKYGGPPNHCSKPGGSYKQQIAVFVDWANRNVHRSQEPNIIGVLAAWREAFPCAD